MRSEYLSMLAWAMATVSEINMIIINIITLPNEIFFTHLALLCYTLALLHMFIIRNCIQNI